MLLQIRRRSIGELHAARRGCGCVADQIDANHRRRVRGRELPYEFRSVEQLRYDFERDVEAAGGTLGESA